LNAKIIDTFFVFYRRLRVVLGLVATGAATGFGLAVGAAAAAWAEVTAVVVGAAAAAPAAGLSTSSVACWIHTNNKRTNAAGL
jgi:hypothetical protein